MRGEPSSPPGLGSEGLLRPSRVGVGAAPCVPAGLAAEARCVRGAREGKPPCPGISPGLAGLAFGRGRNPALLSLYREPNQTKLVTFFQTDLSGYIPRGVVDAFFPRSMAGLYANLQKAVR